MAVLDYKYTKNNHYKYLSYKLLCIVYQRIITKKDDSDAIDFCKFLFNN